MFGNARWGPSVTLWDARRCRPNVQNYQSTRDGCGRPKAWFRCGSSRISQSRFMISRLVRDWSDSPAQRLATQPRELCRRCAPTPTESGRPFPKPQGGAWNSAHDQGCGKCGEDPEACNRSLTATARTYSLGRLPSGGAYCRPNRRSGLRRSG